VAPFSRIPADPAGRAKLHGALDDQLANWYDLLTGRRRLDSFPVTGVVSSLVRDQLVAAFQQMAALATKAGVEGRQRLTIHTPLIALSKGQIIATGLSLGVDYALTTSCYDPSPQDEACGTCDACQLRRKGSEELGEHDPIAYQAA